MLRSASSPPPERTIKLARKYGTVQKGGAREAEIDRMAGMLDEVLGEVLAEVAADVSAAAAAAP